MLFRNKQRGMTLLETAGIAVVMSIVSMLGFSAADVYSKQITLTRILDGAVSKISELPFTLDINSNETLTMRVRDTALLNELRSVIDSTVLELSHHTNLPPELFKIEGFFQPIFINTMTGSSEGFGSPLMLVQKGMLLVHPEIDVRSQIIQKVEELTLQRGIAESSILAEPTAQRIYAAQDWKYLPNSMAVGLRIVLDVKQSPAGFLQNFMSRPTQLFDVKAIHVRGGVQ